MLWLPLEFNAGCSAEEMVSRRDEQCPMGASATPGISPTRRCSSPPTEAKHITGTELVVYGGLTGNCV